MTISFIISLHFLLWIPPPPYSLSPSPFFSPSVSHYEVHPLSSILFLSSISHHFIIPVTLPPSSVANWFLSFCLSIYYVLVYLLRSFDCRGHFASPISLSLSHHFPLWIPLPSLSSSPLTLLYHLFNIHESLPLSPVADYFSLLFRYGQVCFFLIYLIGIFK